MMNYLSSSCLDKRFASTVTGRLLYPVGTRLMNLIMIGFGLGSNLEPTNDEEEDGRNNSEGSATRFQWILDLMTQVGFAAMII
jgi:hypothetical protein